MSSPTVRVIFPAAEYDVWDKVAEVAFTCWASEISSLGLSIAVGRTLVLALPGDGSAREFSTAEFVSAASDILVGIFNNGDSAKWLDLHFVRLRTANEDLLETGLQVDRKIETKPSEAEDFTNALRLYFY